MVVVAVVVVVDDDDDDDVVVVSKVLGFLGVFALSFFLFVVVAFQRLSAVMTDWCQVGSQHFDWQNQSEHDGTPVEHLEPWDFVDIFATATSKNDGRKFQFC